jgi:methyl-accepting chemotaxis protein
MELEEFEKVLTKSRDGDFSVRVDEYKVSSEHRSLARLLNSTLEKAEQSDTLKRRADLMIKHNPMAIAILKKDKSRVAINKMYEKMWEGTHEELMKKKLYDFDIKVLSGDDFYACFTSKKLSVTECFVRFTNGKQKYLTLYALPILDKAGEIDGAFYIWADLTELHEKIDAAKEMERRVNAMIQDNPLAIAVLRKDKSRVSINKQYETAWRGTHDELMKKKLYDFDITVLSGEHFYACFETKKLAVTETLVKFPDGVKKYLTLYAIPILDTAGELDGAFYVWVDYTDLHEKMDAVKEVEQRVDRILQENPYPLFTITPDLSLTMANQAFQKLTGYSKDRLASLSMKEFKFKKNKGESVEGTIRSKRRSQGESVIEFPNGTFILEWYYIPLLDAAGNVENLLVVYNDITETRRKEEEVKKLMEEAKNHAESLSTSAAVLENGLSLMAKGDLSFQVPLVEGDPLVKLKQDYNKASGSIRDLILELEKAVEQMKVTTEDTSKSTQEISKSTEQVAIQTQKSADGAKKQMDEIERVSKEVSDLSASIEEIASTSHTLMEHAGKAASEGNTAAELGKVATAKMQVVEKIAGESVNEITALNEKMKEISTIVKMIADISSQTNLLALNAAIEAARAGEHGRGFAVVAGEVRNLAGESKSATGNIEELINSIQTSSNKTAAAINSSYKEIQAGIESVNKTVEALNRITAESNIVSQGVTEITKATEAQAEATTRVISGVEQTNTITHENQERMEDMAALAEETSASTEEIASASTELASMADHLKTRMNTFKLR